jgi:predicted MPP superfamily phosphohydrolase
MSTAGVSDQSWNPIRILHLSDFHFRTSTNWASEPVLMRLADDVRKLVAEGLVPDLVAITGDLAFSGKEAEYTLAELWLQERLLPAIGRSGAESLYLVPGNHDVDRSKVGVAAKILQDGLLKGQTQQALAEILSDSSQRGLLLGRHLEYLRFANRFRATRQLEVPWWSRTVTIRGVKLHLAGLDSAWMSTGDEDQSRLLVSDWQVQQVIKGADGCDLSVALIHHPWGWLAEWDRTVRPGVCRSCGVVLSGHLHQAEPEQRSGLRKAVLELAAGACYEGSNYQNSYQLVELDPVAGRARVHLRVWDQRYGLEWVPDRIAAPPDGVVTFELRKSQRNPSDSTSSAVRASADDEVINHYLEEVLAQTGRIDIRGISSAPGAGRAATYYAIEELYTPLRSATPFRGNELGLCLGEGRTGLPSLLRQERLLLVGNPGGGKTTFLRLISCVLAKDLLGLTPDGRKTHLGLPLDKEPPLPVFLRLASLADLMDKEGAGADGFPHRWLGRYLTKYYDAETAEAIVRRMDKGRCALLLDGLDEVAEPRLRQRVISLVDGLLRKYGRNLIVITSRPHGYEAVSDLRGVATAIIDDFGEAEIKEFLTRWLRALYPEEEAMARDEYGPKLRTAIAGSRRIRRMARNPVMLTCLCVVHWNEHLLPEGKADLLAAVLRWLVASRTEQRKARGDSDLFAEECFKALAWSMTTDPGGKRAITDLARAAELLAKPFRQLKGITDIRQVRILGLDFLEREALDSGIVEKVGENQIRFWHLTFQEHYTAKVLSELGLGEGPTGWWHHLSPHLWDRQWNEVVEHFVGCLVKKGLDPVECLLWWVRCLATDPDDLVVTARVVGVLGRLLRILDAYEYRPRVELQCTEVCDRALSIFTVEGAARVPVKERIAAAEALGQTGDPRLEDPIANMLPVPGRPGLLLGKYPVTVQEYEHFVEDGGYGERRFWDEDWDVREKNGWTQPDDWDKQLETLNRPVINVSWYEAVAYCRWRSAQLGSQVRLPTEEEWYAAAKHPQGKYPWGSQEPTPELANYSHQGSPGNPTPVGIYPAGVAPGGHRDLAGNVWEWCQDDVSKEYYQSAKSIFGEQDSRALRALRGGSWSSDPGSLLSASRYRSPARLRSQSVGFRVAAASTV